ncbi:hypothetical protein CLU97_2699 [Chryseobacterium sp. 7]|nr:hypothetical protein CLU97_2699 [Chryseobacterium sp. 7]
MESVSKIYFIDNPYPNGHAIETFSWSGRIDEYGFIWFDFHLKTENYDTHDDENNGKKMKTYLKLYSKLTDLNPKSNKREYKLDQLKATTL